MADALVLPAKLGLSAVTPLHGDLISQQNQNVTLDLTNVTYLGALCLQVLIAAARHAKSAGTQFNISNVDDRVLEQMRVMGVTPETITEGQQ